MQSFKIITILALAIAADAAAITSPIVNTLQVSTPGEISKRATYMDVFGSGTPKSASDGSSLSVNVNCGKVGVWGFDGYSGLCTAEFSGSFSGCDSCEWYGSFERYSISVTTKCANAHVTIGAGSDSDGGGNIGENIQVHDCNGKAGGGAKTMKLCAGSNWSLYRC